MIKSCLTIKRIKEYGLLYGISLKFLSFFNFFSKSSYQKHFIALTYRYLDKNYKRYILKDKDYTRLTRHNGKYKVFVCWWQGINENTPELVRKCIENIKLNFKNHEVIIIDKNNVNKYTSIPSYIIEKVEKGFITLTHLSDIIRVHLLSDYDSCWIDSTCWVTNGIESELDNYMFYTNKLKPDKKLAKYVSQGRWSGFFMKSNKDNIIISSVRRMLDAYWENHNSLINYFILDYLISIVYAHSLVAKKMIDEVPYNNEHIHDLIKFLGEPYDSTTFKNMILNTNVFKLTYKIDLSSRPYNSFYDVIILKKNYLSKS